MSIIKKAKRAKRLKLKGKVDLSVKKIRKKVKKKFKKKVKKKLKRKVKIVELSDVENASNELKKKARIDFEPNILEKREILEKEEEKARLKRERKKERKAIEFEKKPPDFEYLPITERSVRTEAQHKLLHGSRGGAKTTTLLADFAYYLDCGYGSKYTGLLLRTEYKELDVLKDRCREIFLKYYGARIVGEDPQRIFFPGGEKLIISTMKKASQDKMLIGKEYPWIGFDEITLLDDQEVFSNLVSCNRSTLPIPSRITATCNPWGLGRDWVKRVFQIGIQANGKIFKNSYKKTCVHIFSSIFDNKYLLESEGLSYLEGMSSFSKGKVQAWLLGSWDFVIGGFFEHCWSPEDQIIKPFEIPTTWDCFRSFDRGYAAPFAVGWYVISDGSSYYNEKEEEVFTNFGDVFKIYEYYGGAYASKIASKKTGIYLSNTKVGRNIKQIDQYLEKELNIKVCDGIADPEIFKEANNNSIASQMAKEGVNFEAADNSSRINNASVFSTMLHNAKTDSNGVRSKDISLRVWDNCHDFIRTIPGLKRCEIRLEDISQRPKQEDHIFDETKYALAYALKKYKTNFTFRV